MTSRIQSGPFAATPPSPEPQATGLAPFANWEDPRGTLTLVKSAQTAAQLAGRVNAQDGFVKKYALSADCQRLMDQFYRERITIVIDDRNAAEFQGERLFLRELSLMLLELAKVRGRGITLRFLSEKNSQVFEEEALLRAAFTPQARAGKEGASLANALRQLHNAAEDATVLIIPVVTVPLPHEDDALQQFLGDRQRDARGHMSRPIRFMPRAEAAFAYCQTLAGGDITVFARDDRASKGEAVVKIALEPFFKNPESRPAASCCAIQ